MKIIFNGDDLGISRSCNWAMYDCFKYGVMRSASLMVNMPYAKEAIEIFKDCSDFSIGLHFNLTVGKPIIEDLYSLVDSNGNFTKTILEDSTRVVEEEIRKELYAQFERYVEICGKIPDHINSHHDISRIQYASDIQMEIAQKYNIPVRECFFKTYEYKECTGHLAARLPFSFEKCMEIMNDVNSFIDAFSQEQIASDAIYEIPAHPGYIDQNLVNISSYTTQRYLDADFFMNEKLSKWIDEKKIVLATYKEL